MSLSHWISGNNKFRHTKNSCFSQKQRSLGCSLLFKQTQDDFDIFCVPNESTAIQTSAIMNCHPHLPLSLISMFGKVSETCLEISSSSTIFGRIQWWEMIKWYESAGLQKATTMQRLRATSGRRSCWTQSLARPKSQQQQQSQAAASRSAEPLTDLMPRPPTKCRLLTPRACHRAASVAAPACQQSRRRRSEGLPSTLPFTPTWSEGWWGAGLSTGTRQATAPASPAETPTSWKDPSSKYYTETRFHLLCTTYTSPDVWLSIMSLRILSDIDLHQCG